MNLINICLFCTLCWGFNNVLYFNANNNRLIDMHDSKLLQIGDGAVSLVNIEKSMGDEQSSLFESESFMKVKVS